jgi:hypothetical protein
MRQLSDSFHQNHSNNDRCTAEKCSVATLATRRGVGSNPAAFAFYLSHEIWESIGFASLFKARKLIFRLPEAFGPTWCMMHLIFRILMLEILRVSPLDRFLRFYRSCSKGRFSSYSGGNLLGTKISNLSVAYRVCIGNRINTDLTKSDLASTYCFTCRVGDTDMQTPNSMFLCWSKEVKYAALKFMLNGKFERKVCFIEIDPTWLSLTSFLSNFPFSINFKAANFTSVLQHKNKDFIQFFFTNFAVEQI